MVGSPADRGWLESAPPFTHARSDRMDPFPLHHRAGFGSFLAVFRAAEPAVAAVALPGRHCQYRRAVAVRVRSVRYGSADHGGIVVVDCGLLLSATGVRRGLSALARSIHRVGTRVRRVAVFQPLFLAEPRDVALAGFDTAAVREEGRMRPARPLHHSARSKRAACRILLGNVELRRADALGVPDPARCAAFVSDACAGIHRLHSFRADLAGGLRTATPHSGASGHRNCVVCRCSHDSVCSYRHLSAARPLGAELSRRSARAASAPKTSASIVARPLYWQEIAEEVITHEAKPKVFGPTLRFVVR